MVLRCLGGEGGWMVEIAAMVKDWSEFADYVDIEVNLPIVSIYA